MPQSYHFAPTTTKPDFFSKLISWDCVPCRSFAQLLGNMKKGGWGTVPVRTEVPQRSLCWRKRKLNKGTNCWNTLQPLEAVNVEGKVPQRVFCLSRSDSWPSHFIAVYFSLKISFRSLYYSEKCLKTHTVANFSSIFFFLYVPCLPLISALPPPSFFQPHKRCRLFQWSNFLDLFVFPFTSPCFFFFKRWNIQACFFFFLFFLVGAESLLCVVKLWRPQLKCFGSVLLVVINKRQLVLL